MPFLEKEQLECDMVKAIRILYRRDRDLIVQRVNERCLSARFYAYFENLISSNSDYSGLNVDPEYNRRGVGSDPKRMIIEGKKRKPIPDVILHKRGSHDANICVIEFKKKWRCYEDDYKKLKAFTGSGDYCYNYGVHIVLRVNDVVLTWFRHVKDVETGEMFYRAQYDTSSWGRTPCELLSES